MSRRLICLYENILQQQIELEYPESEGSLIERYFARGVRNGLHPDRHLVALIALAPGQMFAEFGSVRANVETREEMQDYRRMPRTAQFEECPIDSVRRETEPDDPRKLGVEKVPAPQEDSP